MAIINREPTEDEMKFVAETNYLFTFEECAVLVKDGYPTLFKEVDFDTIEEALELMTRGFTPIPF